MTGGLPLALKFYARRETPVESRAGYAARGTLFVIRRPAKSVAPVFSALIGLISAPLRIVETAATDLFGLAERLIRDLHFDSRPTDNVHPRAISRQYARKAPEGMALWRRV